MVLDYRNQPRAILTSDRPRRYGVAVLAVAIALVLKLLLMSLLHVDSPFLLFFAAVMVSVWYGGLGPGLLATTLATTCSAYFFIIPLYSFSDASLDQGLRVGLFTLEVVLMIWLCSDLQTAKQRAESKAIACQQSEKRLRLLFEGIKDYAIFALDPEGYIVSWNAGAENIQGCRSKDIIGQHFSCCYQRQDIEQGKPEIELQIAATEGRFEGEHWQLRQNGSRFWANVVITSLTDETGNLCGFVNVTRDITERKRAERAVQENEKYFRRAILNAPFPIMIHAEDGKVLQINQTWTDLTAYAHHEIPTIAQWTEKAYGQRKEVVKADIDKLYDLDRRLEEGKYSITTKSGETRIWNFSSAPLGKLSDGRRLVISMAVDVTECAGAKAEQQLNETLESRVRDLTAKLEEANNQNLTI